MQNTIYEYIAPELWTLMDLGVHFGPGLIIVGRGFIGYPKGRNRDIKLVN